MDGFLDWSRDARLVRAALRGDKVAFGHLVERHLVTVEAVAYAHTRCRADAEDISQETFLKAYQSLNTLKNGSKFRAWVVAISRNLCLNLLARRSKEEPLREELAATLSTPAPDHAQEELLQLLHNHLLKMPEDTREVLLLHYYAGKSLREIGAILGINREATAKRLQRGRDALARAIVANLEGLQPSNERTRARARTVAQSIFGAPATWKMTSTFAKAGEIQAAAGNAGVIKLATGVVVAACVIGTFYYHQNSTIAQTSSMTSVASIADGKANRDDARSLVSSISTPIAPSNVGATLQANEAKANAQTVPPSAPAEIRTVSSFDAGGSIASPPHQIVSTAEENSPTKPTPSDATAESPFSGAVISGQVLDENDLPIEGALVEWGLIDAKPAERDRARTSGDGTYALEISRGGAGYRLGVSAHGYAPAYQDYAPPWSHSIDTTDENTPPPSSKDFKLEQGHWLEGTVVDEQGKPVAAAVVAVFTPVEGIESSFSSPSYPTPLPGTRMQEMITGDDGAFRFDEMPPENVNVRITAPHRQVNDANYPVDTIFEIQMNGSGEPGRINARVLDADTGEPVAEFIVARRHNAEQKASTSTNGECSISDLTFDREYEIHVYSKGYTPWKGKLRAKTPEDETADTVELVKGPPLIGKLVEASTKKPIANADMIWAVAGRNAIFDWNEWDRYIDGYHALENVQRARTDSEGGFWFAETEKKPGTLIVLADGYGRFIVGPSNRIPLDANGVLEVTLQPQATISGTLNLAPVKNESQIVNLTKERGTSLIEEWFEQVTVDQNGRFRFTRLAPGTYRVGVKKSLTKYSFTFENIAIATLDVGTNREIARQQD